MATVAGRLTHSGRARELLAGALLVALALSVGFVAGNPGVAGIPVMVIALAAVAGAWLLSQVYAGFLVMVTCCFMFMVVAVSPNRYLNALDLILLFMFPTALFGSLRREARSLDRLLEAGPAHDRIREASDRFGKAAVAFFALAVLSLVPMVFRIGAHPAMNSAFAITRSIEGAMLFPLGLWWLRSESRMRQLYGAACLGGFLLTIVSLHQKFVVGTERPGMTWIVNQPTWPTEDPNQTGVTIVLLTALVFAHHAVRPRFWNILLLIAAPVVLLLTLSRSSILAMGTFLAPNLRRVRPLHIVIGLVLIGLTLLFMPEQFWTRMARTVTLQYGSYELFTFMIRIYGYLTNLRIFLDNWLFGTGFLGGMYVSQRYNELGLSRLGAENYFLETAVGMGVIGLSALALCFVRLFQLGRAVREVAPPGTLGHQLARLHGPLIVGIMVANLTGNNLNGVIGIGQIALWSALLVRAGHLAVRATPEAVVDPSHRE